MRNIVKRRNNKIGMFRNCFKEELYDEIRVNPALAIAIVNTYSSWKHRRHIGKIWALLGHNHKEAHKDYCDKLIGKHLTGDETIWRTLYFASDNSKKIREDYIRVIPEKYAMGDALSVAYRFLK